MRVAIAHDYLTQRGGAERVVLSMLKAFPHAPLVTLFHAPDQTYPEFREANVTPSRLNAFPLFRTDPRKAFPLLPAATRLLPTPEADVLVISSSGWAHGVRTDAPKIVYCHNPPRWIYQSDEYLSGLGRGPRLAARAGKRALRRWDQAVAREASLYVANSTSVARRIRAVYGIEPRVLFPPSSLDVDGPQEPVPGVRPGFWLTVARGRAYKNTDLVSRAVLEVSGAELVVVGVSGSSDRVHGVGRVSDAELRWLYANCRGLLSASHEDFGLTPIEANRFGKPAVVVKTGGFLDTVVQGVNGHFFSEASVDAVRRALLTLPELDPSAIRAHADRFSEPRFIASLHALVDEFA